MTGPRAPRAPGSRTGQVPWACACPLEVLVWLVSAPPPQVTPSPPSLPPSRSRGPHPFFQNVLWSSTRFSPGESGRASCFPGLCGL